MTPERVPVEQHVREFTRSCVRAGLLGDRELHEEVELAISTELPGEPDPRALAGRWVAEFRDELRADQATWPEVTDHDRLQAAFAALTERGLVVLQGCEDHWAAKTACDEAGGTLRGVAWFTPPDVWHAIDEGMLEVNVWHGSTANVALGDPLLDEVVAVLEEHGLPAHFDEGRIEVSAHWQRPLTEPS